MVPSIIEFRLRGAFFATYLFNQVSDLIINWATYLLLAVGDFNIGMNESRL